MKVSMRDMDYTHLGRTGTSVSRIVLGTMNFGDRTSEEESFAIMDRALELGVNFFDTANGYGGAGGRGATEEIIGRWFAARPGVRDDIVLATKVHSPMVDPTPTAMSSTPAARHGDAGEEVDADQGAERRVAQPELVEQEGRERGHRLELEADGGSRKCQNGKYQPALGHLLLATITAAMKPGAAMYGHARHPANSRSRFACPAC